MNEIEFDVNVFANDNKCDFITLNDFNDNDNFDSCSYFSLICINIRSLKRHFTELQTLLHLCKHAFSLVIVCETWLCSDFDNMFHLDGYLFHTLCRTENYGGIRLYYRSHLNVEVLNNQTLIHDSCEILASKITIKNLGPINLFCIYRPPLCSLPHFTQYIETLIADKFPNEKCLIVGDLNENFFNLDICNNFDFFINF